MATYELDFAAKFPDTGFRIRVDESSSILEAKAASTGGGDEVWGEVAGEGWSALMQRIGSGPILRFY